MDSQKVNIPKSTDDPFYRYQRNVLHVQSGPGNTTILINLENVSRQIDRPVSTLMAWFKKKTAANVYIKNQRFLIQGSHKAQDLDDLIEEYIKKFVLCKLCSSPETSEGTCKACGAS